MNRMQSAVKLAALCCGGLLITPASAVYFNSIIYDMDSGKDFISRKIVNDTQRVNFYTIEAYKIDRPGKGDERVIIDKDKDLVWSPLKFTIQPDGGEYFKLYYRGPKDRTERYYRVVFKESPIALLSYTKDSKRTDIVPVVAMSTILIVRPRKIDFKYDIDEASGTITNTGNTYFRVILQTGCSGDDESSLQFYMLPGERWQGPQAKANNKKFIVAQSRYYRLGRGCFSDESPLNSSS